MSTVRGVLRSWLVDCSCLYWACWQHWRSWFKPLVAGLYCVVLLIALPLLVWDLYEEGTPDQFKAWFVAGIFVLLTIPVFRGGAYATPAELHTASPTETHHQVRSQTPLFIRCLSQHTSYYLYADPVKCVFVINKHCVKPAVCETRDTCNRIFMQVVLVETSLCLETVKFQLTS